jgi:hypothetical protein
VLAKRARIDAGNLRDGVSTPSPNDIISEQL